MRRVLPVAVAALALVASQFPASAVQPTTSDLSARASAVAAKNGPVNAKRVKTDFLLGASAAGTRVDGGMIPVNSGDTGKTLIGCQRFVGKTKNDFVADVDVDVPGLGTIQGVRTKVWTQKKGKRVSSFAKHSIASIVLADTPLGKLEIAGVESLTEAFWNGSKFGANVKNQIARIDFTPPIGPKVSLPIPAPGVPITIPGLLRLDLGRTVKNITADGARATGAVLRITVIPSSTRITVAATRARIDRTTTTGLFNGYGAGAEATALGDIAGVGRTVVQTMPCVGTDGENVVTSAAGIDLDPLGEVGAAVAGVNASRKGKKAKATALGQVGDISLFGGILEIKAVTGVATVQRKANGKILRSTQGTHVVEVVANGTSYDLDALGEIEIPGLAKLDGAVVEKLPFGLKVIGLRITLLDGSLAVIDLGVAKSTLKPRKKK